MNNNKMTKQECYNFFFEAIKIDTHSCKRCKKVAKYSMQKFNKQYKKEFNKRFEEIWSWHIKYPKTRILRLGDISRLRDVVIGKEPRDSYGCHYNFEKRKVARLKW